MNKEPMTVDALLDNVDLTFKGYIPSALAFEFFSFIRLVLGEEPENSNPLAHYFLIDTIFQQPNVEFYFRDRHIEYNKLKGKTSVLCTREFAKSVLIGTFLPLFMAWKGEIPGFGKVNYGLYVGDSMENNVKTTMQTIESVYGESAFLRDEFEEAKFTDRKVYLVRKPRTSREISEYKKHVSSGNKPETVPGRNKREFAMNGYGAQTGLRGTRKGLQRPQFAIMDDMVKSESDANSDTVLGSIQSTVDSDVLNALHGGGSIAIIIGTPYNKKDPVYKACENGAWVPVVFPICKEIHEEMTKEEFVGVWEDRHSYTKVMKRYDAAIKGKSVRSFMQELMLRIASEDDRLIPDEYINWFSREDLTKKGGEYNWYITTDFTTTGSKGSDFSGIAVWAVGSNNDWFLVDLSLKKLDLSQQYIELFRFARQYKKFNGSITVGIEIDGQQKIHIFALKELMVKHNEYFTVGRQRGTAREGILSRLVKGNKFDRFQATVPYFQNSKIWFPKELKTTPDMREMLTELRYVSIGGIGSSHDDALDLVSQMTMLEIYAPSDNMTTVEEYKDPIWHIDKEDNEYGGYSSYTV